MTGVRFARSGEVNVAYRVVGDGPIDLVYAQGAYTHLDVYWELPAFRHYCERLAEFTRLILFDKRGYGMSDRVPGATTLEERMDDIRAIMDAVGSSSAPPSSASPKAGLLRCCSPRRTRSARPALMLQGAEVRERTDEAWPWGEATPEEHEASDGGASRAMGSGHGDLGHRAERRRRRAWARAWRARVQVNAATPSAAEAFMRMAFDIDVRDVVPTVNVPTLVVHAVGDRVCHVENGRFLARNIPGARYVELLTDDHVPWFDPETTVAEIREFLTGRREAESPDRVLVTILFTDLAMSTELCGLARRSPLARPAGAAPHDGATRADPFRRPGGRHRGRRLLRDVRRARPRDPVRRRRSSTATEALGLGLRAGLHTGEVEVLGDKVAGIAVNIGARVAAHAAPGEILVSSTVRDLVAGSGISFVDRGPTTLKGIEGTWQVFAVAG